MAADKVSPLRSFFTHAFMIAVGITMILPFIWSLATSFKSEAEVFQDHHIPRSVTLGSINGMELNTRTGEEIYLAKPVKGDDGIQKVGADGQPQWQRGERLTLRIGNPTLQGSPGEQATTRDGVALNDDAGVPVLNSQVLPDGRYGGWTCFQDFRKFKKRAEPILVPRDFDDGANEKLAKACIFYARFADNWETMVEQRWGGMIPLILTEELRATWASKVGNIEAVALNGVKLRDPSFKDKERFYNFRDITWQGLGEPVRLVTRPAKVVTADGLPIPFEATFPIYRTDDDPLMADRRRELKVYVGNATVPDRIFGRDLQVEKRFRLLWSNYAIVFADPQIKMSLFAWNTLFVGIAVVLMKLATSSLAAFAFARLEWPGRDKLFFAYLATMMIPGIVTQIPNYMILKELGWLNTFYALIIPGASTAYGTFLLRQYMLTLPKGLEEAARIDGAGLLRVWWDVVLPLCRPALITLAIFTFSSTWQSFSGPLILAPEEEVRVLGVALYNLSNESSQSYNLLMAASLVMMIPMLLLFVFGQKYFVRGIQLGGVKG